MMDCKPETTIVDAGVKLKKDGNESEVDATLYKQTVCSLRYICNTRPDIVFGVGLIHRFMEKPRSPHLVAAKRILRYIRGTQDYGLMFSEKGGPGNAEIYGYIDSDWSGDKDDRKSI